MRDAPPPDNAAERLRRRYPPPLVPRPLLIGLVGVLAALGVGWLIWAALASSRPLVAAQVSAYTVTSDTAISVTLTVDRTDPGVPVVCRIVAQADDHQPVGERQVPVEASTVKVADVKIVLTTVRRAVTATVAECRRA